MDSESGSIFCHAGAELNMAEFAINLQRLDADLSTSASAAPDHQTGLYRLLQKEHFLIEISSRSHRIDHRQINNEA